MLRLVRLLKKRSAANKRIGATAFYARCVSNFPNVDARLLVVSMACLYDTRKEG